jgi:LCP family protein required for cell wall assembly
LSLIIKNKKRVFIVLGAIIILLICAVFLYIYLNTKPAIVYNQKLLIADARPETEEYIAQPQRLSAAYKENFYTFLLVGSDMDAYHADTIIVASYNVASGEINLISIPRDTRVDVSRNPKKINAALGLGGIEKLKDEVQSLLGFTPQYYAAVELQGFVDLIDLIGGVDFNVPVDMKKDDYSQNLHIDLKTGWQKLSGEKAIQLVRYRGYAIADLKRMEIQRDFIIAALKQCASLENLGKTAGIIKIAQKYLDTNLTLREMQWFARKIRTISSEAIKTQTLPIGKQGQSGGHFYMYLDKDKTLELINATINPYSEDIPSSALNILEEEKYIPSPDNAEEQENSVQENAPQTENTLPAEESPAQVDSPNEDGGEEGYGADELPPETDIQSPPQEKPEEAETSPTENMAGN